MKYSAEDSSQRDAEMQAWVHFGDFLDESEGNEILTQLIISF